MTRRTFGVVLDALKIDLKNGEHYTTAYARLPSEVDTDHLVRAHDVQRDKHTRLVAAFVLHIEEQSGTRRKIEFLSRGTRTKDYRTCAVLEKPYNSLDRLETLIAPGVAVLTLEVRIDDPKRDEQGLPFGRDAALGALDAVAKLSPKRGEGIDTVELSSGGTTVTLTAETGKAARRALKRLRGEARP